MNFTSLHTHGFNMSYEEDDLGERVAHSTLVERSRVVSGTSLHASWEMNSAEAGILTAELAGRCTNPD
jgi:hypothetical protein